MRYPYLTVLLALELGLNFVITTLLLIGILLSLLSLDFALLNFILLKIILLIKIEKLALRTFGTVNLKVDLLVNTSPDMERLGKSMTQILLNRVVIIEFKFIKIVFSHRIFH